MTRIVVDTGVLWKPEVLRILADLPYRIVVPAVAATERARQVARDGWTPSEFLGDLAANGFEIESFQIDHGLRHATAIHDDDRWQRLARDAFIAGHVDEDSFLWTTNPEDFLEVGVPEYRIFAVG